MQSEPDMGASKNQDFCALARRRRTEKRSLHEVNEHSSTTATPPACKKTIFRGAHMTFEEYLSFLEEYWTLFDLEEAQANRKDSDFHDIRL